MEIKKSALGAGSKAMHLAYLGDAVIGADVNVGAGNTLLAGMRVFPGVTLPEGAIAF